MLSTERPLGQAGSGRIPFGKIVWFAERHLRLASDLVDTFLAVLAAMDRAWATWQAEEQAKLRAELEARSQGGGGGRGLRRR